MTKHNNLPEQIDTNKYLNCDSLYDFLKFIRESGRDIYKLTDIQIIVEYYKFLKEFHEIPNWNGNYFRRFSKPAKDILAYALNNPLTAMEVIEYVAWNFDRKGVMWTLETIYRSIPDYHQKYIDEKEGY